MKRPTKERSALQANTPLYQKDEATGNMIADILERFPQHKRVLFLRSK